MRSKTKVSRKTPAARPTVVQKKPQRAGTKGVMKKLVPAKDGRDATFPKDQQLSQTEAEEACAAVDPIISLNVGGVKFQVRKSILVAHPTSLLGAMLLSPTADRDKLEFFFDGNPRAFESILDMYRRGTLKCPPDMDSDVFAAELDFWQIPSIASVDGLLDVDARLLTEASVANTKKFEGELVAADAEKRPEPPSKRSRSRTNKRAEAAETATESQEGVHLSGEARRVMSTISSLSADLEAQITKLRGSQRILSSVRKAMRNFSAGLYEWNSYCGLADAGSEDWRLLQSATEAKTDRVAMQDGLSLDEVLTSIKGNEAVEERDKVGENRASLLREDLSGEDSVLYDWWAKTVGEENLELFWMPFFVRPDRERVYVDFTFAYQLKTRKEFYDMLQVKLWEEEAAAAAEEDAQGAKGKRKRAGEAKKAAGFKLGRMDVDFRAITLHGIHGCWSVDLEDFQNGGYYSLVRYDVPLLRISWDTGKGPSLEERLAAVLRGEVDPSPQVSVLQAARPVCRNVRVDNPKLRHHLPPHPPK